MQSKPCTFAPSHHLSAIAVPYVDKFVVRQVLLKKGAVVDQADNDGVTPLLACIEAVPEKDKRLAVAELGTVARYLYKG